jgi:hypothetical protein
MVTKLPFKSPFPMEISNIEYYSSGFINPIWANISNKIYKNI